MPRIISPEALAALRKEFSMLSGEVSLHLFTGEGINDEFNKAVSAICEEMAKLSLKITYKQFTLGSKEAKELSITTSPVLALNPEKYRIHFYGAPLGEEMRSLLGTIFMASSGQGILTEESTKKVQELKDSREILIFVSPTCPYCPQQVGLAVSAVLANPEKVSVKIVEIYENRDLADKYSVVSVPQTVINGDVIGAGILPEDVFLEALLSGSPVGTRILRPRRGTIKADVVVIGAGPAGLTAAIYAERAGLKTVIIEKMNIGGQVTVTPIVENYPGFTRIGGKTLMDIMAQQAFQYCDIHLGTEVTGIQQTAKGLFDISAAKNRYRARAVILTTGADYKKLGIPGEERFFGRGVSYCATCDGYFFKDGKQVIVVGGGNTALSEALYLDGIGARVSLAHRRGELRAEKMLQETLMARNIPVLWNTVVEEISGNTVVSGVALNNVKDNKRWIMPVEGVFIAIGYEPVNDLARQMGLALTEDQYVQVDQKQRTSKRFVYAAGDVTGGIKQIVTAAGQGAVAAIAAFEDLMNPYWKGKGDMF